jgi:hypothetical protein
MAEEQKKEKLSTEGDLVVHRSGFPYYYQNAWIPFSQRNKVYFYDPEEHQDIAEQLRDAPIQSTDQHKEEEEEEEKELSSQWINSVISLK